MLFSSTLALSFGAVFALGAPATDNSFTCGSYSSPESIATAQRRIQVDLLSGEASSQAAVVIPVQWHIISEDGTPRGGNIPDGLLDTSVAILNRYYNSNNIFFRTQNVSRVTNPNWYYNVGDGNAVERDMKSTRQGNVQTLNVYTVGNIQGAPPGYSIDGYATFPWDYQANPNKDGVVLQGYTFPGGPHPARNGGVTLVHEVGHWLGLLHTFQGGCGGPGDYVDDTPFEASPGSGCPVGRDSCPQPGLDPIYNPMDYTDDACRTQFTQGQFQRIAAALRQFRGINS